ncbi:MAG: phosphodiesterase [Gammaproteobacteria bacterium]|nr:phosphodiesterase [Gammaproteobacteria bacterium]
MTIVSSVVINPALQDSVYVIQLTDTHISADPATRFAGVDTDVTLAAVVKAANRHAPRPDCVLVTGDLVEAPSEAAYLRLLPHLQSISAPVYCLPGNHDEPALLRSVLNRDRGRTPKVIETAQWIIVMLDTWESGNDGGRLSKGELETLRCALEGAGDRHALVCLHHPPVSIRSPWMDEMSLANPDEFFAVLDEFSNVRAVAWGHIHQEFESERNGVLLLGSPSTCVQFAPCANEYIVVDEPPAYREFELGSDGRLRTRVHHVAV